MFITRYSVIAILLFSTTFIATAQVQFKTLSLDEAKSLSRSTGKNVFIDFRADWCKPCVAMEQETFSDAQVGTAINNKFIPIKADVDYFEWADVQEAYNVGVLPTILIINSQGIVQQRLLGQKSASGLMSELSLPYNGSSNTNEDAEEDYAESTPTTSTAKKECVLKTWLRKISR